MKRSLILSAFVPALLILASASCVREAGADEQYALYYSGITEISPGTNIALTPTWRGGTPTDFSIAGLRLYGINSEADCFSVEPASGRFTITGSENVSTGKWSVDISCVFDGSSVLFRNAIEITMLKPAPDFVKLEPSLITVPADSISAGFGELPTARIFTQGSAHLKISGYKISAIYRNGVPCPSALDFFQINQDGLVSIVPGSVIQGGLYTFDFKITTAVVGEESDECLFSKALSINVTAPPTDLGYLPYTTKVETGYVTTTAEPQLQGSIDEISYSIINVAPNNSVGITIDPVTGVLTFPRNDAIKVGDVFVVDIRVSNAYGQKDFPSALEFKVIEYVKPVTKLEYPLQFSKVSGVGFSIEPTDKDGEDVTYAFSNLPAGLEALSIDPASGAISLEKGIELPEGTYALEVSAKNFKSSAKASLTLEILKNPYKFTYVLWGNNMGLEPAEKYGNQFRVEFGAEPASFRIISTDLPQGQPVSFTLTPGWPYSSAPTGVTMDKNTGAFTIKSIKDLGKSEEDFTSARVNACWVTVTCGGKDEAAVTKKIPFFVQHTGWSDGYKIQYTPFAVRINPKTGGRTPAPVITGKSGFSTDGFTMDYRRDFAYYNYGGPKSHEGSGTSPDGRLNTTNKNLLYDVWANFSSAAGELGVNLSAATPVSYWAGGNFSKGRLGFCGCYVDPADLSVVVNPEKFRTQDGYADGAFVGSMTFDVNNNDPTVSKHQIIPIILWFDPSYNE